ncbi:MAG: hypothetical protein Kow00124_23000 [Anaerolineae bacterium]
MLRLHLHLKLVSLALAAGLTLAACAPAQPEGTTPTPAPTSTPWPTLVPAFTPDPAVIAAALETPQAPGPSLEEQFRVDVMEDVVAVFPLEGSPQVPVRIEVVVLSGQPDPTIEIRSLSGDTLVLADNAGPGQPEVLGQFLFPAEGFYELGISTAGEPGQVGVSIYQLPPAELEAGGEFSSTAQELRGTMTHPASYHTFRLPLQRGQRVDLAARALTEGLDLLFRLYDPDGVEVAARDDNVGTDPYLWNFMPRQSGTYTLVLSNFDERVGDYVVQVTPSTSAGQAVIGTRGELNLQGSPRRSSWVTFSGRALDGISVETRPLDDGVDIFLAIYDRYGNRIAAANSGEAGEPESLSLIQLPFDGDYQMELTTLAESGRVDYLIRALRRVDIDDGGPIVPGGYGQVGEIVGPGTLHIWQFEARAGDLIGFDVRATGSTTLDLAFDLYGPDGALLLSRDDVVGLNPVLDRYEVLTTGRYVLAIRNNSGTVGQYEVYVTSPGSPGTQPAPLDGQ